MSNKNEIVSLDQEQAYEEAEKLQDRDRHSSDGAEVYRGMHPEWGPTIIIFPAFGKAIHIPMMMPVQAAIQPEVTVIKNADLN